MGDPLSRAELSRAVAVPGALHGGQVRAAKALDHNSAVLVGWARGPSGAGGWWAWAMGLFLLGLPGAPPSPLAPPALPAAAREVGTGKAGGTRGRPGGQGAAGAAVLGPAVQCCQID